jgi:hypothetical protein
MWPSIRPVWNPAFGKKMRCKYIITIIVLYYYINSRIYNRKMPSQAITTSIPVLPHVKCLLITLYGDEPLRINENNLLGRELQFVFLNQKTAPEKVHGETISVHISHRLTPYFNKFKNAFSLGCYFEKQFNVLMFAHIDAQVNCGIIPAQAIKNFFKRYNINEEFYNEHQALQQYSRSKSFNKTAPLA